MTNSNLIFLGLAFVSGLVLARSLKASGDDFGRFAGTAPLPDDHDVAEALQESYPASDAPGYNPGTTGAPSGRLTRGHIVGESL